MELTKKQKAYIEYSCNNAILSDAQIAKDIGVSTKQICMWKRNPEFRAEIKRQLDAQWEEARNIAQEKMIELAMNNDYRACEFLLKTNGLTATEKVDVNANVNTIKVEVID